MSDFLFRGTIADLDPKLADLTEIEAERQYRKLILIPSESTSPMAVREALSTAFHNIYAEGYPSEHTRWQTEDEIFDYDNRLAEDRRYSDPRYYKGVEYANVVEALARRRCAEAFAATAEGVDADDVYVNVQALSGGPANNAVYHALVQPGDTVMGMDLLFGGHLSHGSRVNRSGKYYNIVSYSIDPETEQINYDNVEAIALEHKPKMIIAGVSSYPWQIDWKRFREIADKVGAYLLTDIAHVAGLVAAGVYPSPVGIADVVSSTTHKTLNGPRGAILMTTDPVIARKLDRAVFPGEQGGPHVNVFAAMALAFKIAQTDQFKELQTQVVANCKAFTDRLAERGFTIPFGGTNTHLMNLDTKSIKGAGGATLSGDLAARLLDLAGITTNRNTIPGDRSALRPSGVRMGMPWVTQRGFKEKESIALADAIADILLAATPYYQGKALRAKVDFEAFQNAKLKVRELSTLAGIDFEPGSAGYPHFYYLDDEYSGDVVAFDLGGERVRQFLHTVMASDVDSLGVGEAHFTRFTAPGGEILATLRCLESKLYRLSVPGEKAALTAAWLRDLSDGYVKFDDDLLRKVQGPVWVRHSTQQADELPVAGVEIPDSGKPWFIGVTSGAGDPLPEFKWEEKEGPIRRTSIYDLHVELGGRMVPFAGWEMPVRYGSVMEEHMAVREAAGIFDAAHMGVYQAEGPEAAAFLDSVCGNDVTSLGVGQSLYTHFLTPDAEVIDDLLIYRRADEVYLVVVNASNDDKDWAWLNAVREGKVKIDNARPWALAFGRGVNLRNLRDPKEGADMRVDIPLQGPRSRDILLAMGVSDADRKKIMKLKRTELCDAVVGGIDLIVSRTGYTGEKMAFELFVHPDKAQELFRKLLEIGKPFGLVPVGLGARDSLRTEAGLPLYGHEMAGDLGNGVAEGGFGSYVKTYKPWFIGRDSFLAREAKRKGIVVRFRFDEQRVRMAHPGDPVVDDKGRVIGTVTSCAADSEGYLLGQAFVDMKFAKMDTKIFIYQGAPDKASKSPAELSAGDRVTLPGAATVLRRFPK
ncbi:MAG: glycine cleavage system aminomethyltransferase GcvT [Chloroflexi bacterium]|jgi:glycine hydroxymethyltransferase|nr:glycine cleavage system aminomethyltransferase GcvT [Chloroflexota bacterium]